MPPAGFNIGRLRLATPLLLAPVAGYTDLAFRLVARSCGGVGLACTDLLCPEACLRESHKSLRLAATHEADAPLCMQLYGGDAQKLCDAARWARDRGAHVIDLNMGCPVDKILKKDGGSMLLCDPARTLRLVERIRAAIPDTPLTAKLRLGWDDESIVAPALARDLEKAGIDLITVHGRTTEMKFSGKVRLESIAQVVAVVQKTPVVGNGDIVCPADAAEMFSRTRCAGVMIGRAALSTPWIFRDTWSFLTTGIVPPAPALEEKCRLMANHFDGMIQHRGHRFAISEFRKRISWWAKTMHPCGQLQQDIRAMQSPQDFDRAVERFLDWRQGMDASRAHAVMA